MKVQLLPDQQNKLSRMAAAQGRPVETLVQEAVERLLHYDEWFLRELDKGLAAADRGEFIEHDGIRKMIESRTKPSLSLVLWTKPGLSWRTVSKAAHGAQATEARASGHTSDSSKPKTGHRTHRAARSPVPP